MIVALAYNYAEQEQAGRLAAWIAKLGPCPHTLVIATDKRVTRKFFAEMLAVFENVEEFEFTDRTDHYPESKNLAFQQCALFVADRFATERHWLYLEPDVVPTRAGWLDEIEVAAKAGKKPFLGCLVPASLTHRTPAHMAAPGVYPINMISAGAGFAMNAHEYPFPAVIATVTTSSMIDSPLIRHAMESGGEMPDGCALYHPDRDGKILESLSGKGSEVAERTPPVETGDDAGEAESEEAPLILSGAEPETLAGSNPAPSNPPYTPDQIRDMINSQPQPEFQPRKPLVDEEGRILPGLGKTHPEPWENRLQSEEHIKFLAAELKKYCTRPAYSAHVRNVLKQYKVSKGKPKVKKKTWQNAKPRTPKQLKEMRARMAHARQSMMKNKPTASEDLAVGPQPE